MTCSVNTSKQPLITLLNGIRLWVFVIEKQRVFSAVEIDSVNNIYTDFMFLNKCAVGVNRFEQEIFLNACVIFETNYVLPYRRLMLLYNV